MANSQSLILFSPAKLNLFFRVLKRREDGYHEIASLYQAIGLGDQLHLEIAEKDSLVCDDPEIPNDSSNLIFKALAVFRRHTGIKFPVQFHLTKRIPVQSGLGGGSGNAATALWGLNQLAGKPASSLELAKWAAEFSSDASFFFSSGTAFCTGRGEQLHQTSPLKERTLWLAKPAAGLSTPLVYKNCEPASLLPRDPHAVLQDLLNNRSHFFNDLEQPAFKLMPMLSQLKQRLLDLGFETAVMTGSGTAFFCFGDVSKPALEGIQFYKTHYIWRTKEEWYQHEE